MGSDLGAAAGRHYLERGRPVVVLRGWRGRGPRNVLVRRADGSLVVRPFRGLRRPAEGQTVSGAPSPATSSPR